MYWLSRLILRAAMVLALVALAMSFLGLWPISALMGIFLVATKWMGVRRYSDAMGSASWADEDELRSKGLLGFQGLPIGWMTGRQSLSKTISRIMSAKENSRTACQAFFSGLTGKLHLPISLNRVVSTLVFAPTGAGKGVSIILPFLFLCRDSAVVLDFKGENARLSGKFRAGMGQKVVYLDPYHIVSSASDCLNPLDFIDKDSPNVLDASQALANALVVRDSNERERHWNDMAEMILTAVIAFVVIYGETIDQNLQMVAEIVSDPEKLDMACEAMQKSNKFGGMLARLGHQVKHLQGKERSSVLTTVVRHLRFLNTLAVANISVRSTFNPGELKSGKVTVYLIIPPQHMRAMAGLLRMWITCLFGVIVSKGLDEKNLVHFVLDEAAVLGNLEAIEDAVAMYRGYGCRFIFIFQSVGQLKTMFPNGQDQTLLSNASQVFFGTNDTTTAELVSQRLGEATIFVDSGGSSQSTSWQRNQGVNENPSYSVTRNSNWQQHARRLLKPEEVLTLHPRWAITFTPGVRPIMTWLMRYYEEPWLTSPTSAVESFGRSLGMLLKSCTILCLVIAALIGMGLLIKFRQDQIPNKFPSSPVPYQSQFDRRYSHVR